MFLELLAVIFAGFAGAGAMLLLTRVTRLPKWLIPVGAGAAMLAAAGVGLYPDLASAAARMRGTMTTFEPAIDDAVREAEVYDFLRVALMQGSEGAIPVRGPARFSAGEWDYQFGADGDLSNFSGQEEIARKGAVVYRCLVHGGMII